MTAFWDPPHGRFPLRRFALCAVGVGSLASASCSPCDGVIGCTGTPRLGLSGEFVDRDNLQAPPVPGVRVEVLSRSPEILLDSAATVTSDAHGWWSVSMPARAAGTATVDIVVTPPAPDAPYRVTGLQYATSATRGMGAEAGRWVRRPFISYIGVLIDKASAAPIVGATVTIVRRGGVEIATTVATDTAQKTDSSGMFLYDVKPAALAPLYVDFLIDRPGMPRATIANVTITPGYEWGPPYPTAATTFTLDDAGNVTSAGVRPRRAHDARARDPRARVSAAR